MPFGTFGDTFRNLFGIPPSDRYPGGYEDDIWNNDNDWDNEGDDHMNFGNNFNGNDIFGLFRDSLEMSRVFERHFKDMIENFDSHHMRLHDQDENVHQPVQRSIRDEYLKPGYQSEYTRNNQDAKDSDLDGVIAPSDIDQYIKEGPNFFHEERPRPIQPEHSNPNFYSRVIITRTVTKPDGTTETHRTVKDSRTKEEETTITTMYPDQHNEPNSSNDIYPFPPSDHSSKNIWEKFFGGR